VRDEIWSFVRSSLICSKSSVALIDDCYAANNRTIHLSNRYSSNIIGLSHVSGFSDVYSKPVYMFKVSLVLTLFVRKKSANANEKLMRLIKLINDSLLKLGYIQG